MTGLDPAVVPGLLAAVGWGSGDFCGGLSTRRASLFGVAFVVQAVSLVLALLVAIAIREPLPSSADFGWALAGGGVGLVGMLLLYQGLATGRMALVAPISALLSAAIPVVVGIALQGPPDAVRAFGLVLGLVAILVVSRSSGTSASADGVWLGVGAGIGLGLYAACITRVTPGHVWWPLSAARLLDTTLIALVAIALRRPRHVPRPALPLAATTGVADGLGNAAFFAAMQSGRIDIAAVLSSLYPVTTLILATLLLRERLDRAHGVGIALALLAIVVIAAG